MFRNSPEHDLDIGKPEICIKDYDPLSHLSKLNGQIDSNVTLANTAFAAGYGYNPGKRPVRS